MKKSVFPSALALCLFTVSLLACSKDDMNDKPPVPSKPFHAKWFLESVSIYADAGFTQFGGIAYVGSGADFMDFRPDGTLYYNLLNTKDTIPYTLLPNDSTIVYFEPANATQIPDTVTIRSVTPAQLVLHKINVAGDHGKFIYRSKW